MNKRIREVFENGKAFIPFITGGDPDLETTERLIVEMAASGADMIETVSYTHLGWTGRWCICCTARCMAE